METLIQFRHPEMYSNELFLYNSNDDNFQKLELATKRRGETAYDGEGNKISFKNWFPVFVKESELEKRGISVQDLRKKWQESKCPGSDTYETVRFVI